MPGVRFLVLYSWFYIHGFATWAEEHYRGGIQAYSRFYVLGFIFPVLYYWCYIPGCIFLALYSWLYIPGFVFLDLYSWFIFLVSYSWSDTPGFQFLDLYPWSYTVCQWNCMARSINIDNLSFGQIALGMNSTQGPKVTLFDSI